MKIKNLILTALIMAIAVSIGSAQKNAPNVQRNPANTNAPAGQFSEIWVEYNVVENKRKGMVIHAQFDVQSSLNNDCQLRAGFYYDDAGSKALMGDETGFKSKTGSVVAYKNFTPTYDRAVYEDFQVFVPYTALNMDAGKSKLKLQLFLYDYRSNKIFAKSEFVKFTINQGR